MQAILNDLGGWFWRLIPANPILVRVVAAGSRRRSHAWIRLGYLAVLAVLVVFGVIVAAQGVGGSSLADLAKRATQKFETVSIIQLMMVAVLAPIFTAAAITQEKDSQTFNILLSTPLSNGQIVLGSLLSRLYFVFMLLLAGVPLFCIMMVYGGVTGDKIALSISIAACTALLTGSMAISISVIKIGTGRTIFSFYLAIAMYLISVYVLSLRPFSIPPEAVPAPGHAERMSWLAAFHPFLALDVVLGRTPAPILGSVLHYGSWRAQLLAYPQYSYILMTIVFSMALVLLSLFFVRRGAKEGEETIYSRTLGRILPSQRRIAETRKPRHVWNNPIAWRESVTGASAGGGTATRYAILGIGMILAMLLAIYYMGGSLNARQACGWLYTLVIVELGIALFIATATAATSMTREKESNTLELLLCTPLTSASIIKGKIRGLVAAAGPMLIVPYLTILLFVLIDLFKVGLKNASQGVVNWEALLVFPVLAIAYTSLACMIGLKASIQQKKTLTAVFVSMGLILVVFGGLGSCFQNLLTSSVNPSLLSALWPLAPHTAVMLAIDPRSALADAGKAPAADVLQLCRIIAAVGAACAAAIYVLVGIALHRDMVRNFDMTIRKQSA